MKWCVRPLYRHWYHHQLLWPEMHNRIEYGGRHSWCTAKREKTISNTMFLQATWKMCVEPGLHSRTWSSRCYYYRSATGRVRGDVVKTIRRRRTKVVYVAVIRPLQAPRSRQMDAGSYNIVRVQPVDMFPQARPRWNVVLLGQNQLKTRAIWPCMSFVSCLESNLAVWKNLVANRANSLACHAQCPLKWWGKTRYGSWSWPQCAYLIRLCRRSGLYRTSAKLTIPICEAIKLLKCGAA